MYAGVACLIGISLVATYSIVTRTGTAGSEPDRSLRAVQSSHIDANVPASGNIEQILRRDLGQYFTNVRGKTLAVDFEWLPNGATQSGVSLPKFYLWINIAGSESTDDRGAVRVAAVERERFKVTDFLSERAIRAEPQAINRVFPAPVCDRINAKLAGQ